MKKAEIKVGGLYTARISGKYVTVRVDAIRDRGTISGTHYDVTNLTTNHKTVFHSAAKFRSEVTEGGRLCPFVESAEKTATATPPSSDVLSTSHATEESEHSSDPMTGTRTSIFAAKIASSSIDLTTPITNSHQADTFIKTVGLAAKIAAAQSTKITRVPETVAGYTPTNEQRTILEKVLEILNGDGSKVLVVNAGAGSGKTSTLRMLEEVLHGQIQYTAYNRPLVDESRTKFKKAKCSTGHGLAFAPVGSEYKHRLNGARIRSWEVAQRLGIHDFSFHGTPYTKSSPEWTEAANAAGYNDSDNLPPDDFAPAPIKMLKASLLAGYVSQALKRFSQTADREIGTNHFAYIDGIDQVDEDTGRRGRGNNNRAAEYLLPFARKFWDNVCDPLGTLPFQHDYYVKIWQLRPNCIIPADHILLDEHQDTAEVFADVIKRQSATVILVGDENQRIYEWRGAMNAADLFPDAPVLFLSQSFRFGQAVADVANSILAGLDESTKLNMRGLATIPSRILLDLPTDEYGNPTGDDREDEHVGSVCYLYRTNAGALGCILTEYAAGRRGCLVGKIDEVVKFVEAARDLQIGKRTSHPELAAFENWKEVQKYVEEDPDGGDLKLMVKLIDQFGVKEILESLNNMPKEDRADFVCSTSHKSKGREWDTVVLGADFPPAHKMQDSDRRLLYVAATRAKLVLDLTHCTPFHSYKDKDGNEYPCIEVNFTTDQHSAAELVAYQAAKTAPKMPVSASQSANGGIITPAQKTAANGNVATANGNGQSAPNANGNGRVMATGFTWTNFGNKWSVRGPADIELGSKVKVFRKDGSSSDVVLKSVVRVFDDACIYGV